MKILSIETSCDETGVSILEVKGNKNPRQKSTGYLGGQATFKILANNLNSQIKIHEKYGGVFPIIAKREHQKNLPILLEKTLKKAKLNKNKKPVNLITVTSGPGLEPALWTGIVFAKELAKKWKVPIMPVNHMEGHIFSVFAKNKGRFKIPKINYPILSLLVSGGHTELVLIKNWRNYKIIGETLDDAAGEAFDKVARMLELPYPGGPEISKLAEKVRTSPKPSPYKGEGKIQIKLPRPMMHNKNFDFSFSGLKTAVLYLIRDLKKENLNILQNEKIKQAIALEFENAVVETLVFKTKKAAEKYKIKTLIVAGGVASNKHLKKEVKKMVKNFRGKTSHARSCLSVLFPEKKLSTDNSVMIGMVGYLKYIENRNKKYNIKAKGGLRL